MEAPCGRLPPCITCCAVALENRPRYTTGIAPKEEKVVSRRLRPWTVVNSRNLLDAEPFLKVHVETVELPDGRIISDYYQLEMPSYVCIYAETEDGRALICRQYRHGPRRINFVFPGGHISPDELPLDAAKRELMEETGFEAAAWTKLGSYTVNGNQGGAMSYMFHATGCRRVAEPQSDDLEETEILLMSRAELLSAIGRREIALLSEIALVSMVWQADIAHALATEESGATASQNGP